MAALNRPTKATYEIHEKVTVDTEDNEDHTFCGIMFPVKCKDLLPIDSLVIKSVSVRGQLGPLTVWVSKLETPTSTINTATSNSAEYKFRLNPKYWTKVYDKTHKPSIRTYKELELDTPITLQPGQVKAIYIHSTMSGDEAIVYDNSYYGSSPKRYEDEKLAIMTGRAHVSTRVFGQNPIWGYGNAWRDRREFVGRINYGVTYKLWNPQVQPKFGTNFQNGSRTLFLCQRRWESPFSTLPDECIYYILNMCRWDWFNDSSCDMKARRKREKARLLLEKQLEQEAKEEAEAAATAATAVASASATASLPTKEGEEEDQKIPAIESATTTTGGCNNGRCRGKAKTTGLDDDDDDIQMKMNDADEEDNESMAQEEDDDEDNELDDDHDDDDENFLDSEDGGDDDDDDDDGDWSDDEDQYYRANHNEFTYRDIDSDDEDNGQDDDDMNSQSRRDWIRRQFARIHVLRALASMEDGHVTHVQF